MFNCLEVIKGERNPFPPLSPPTFRGAWILKNFVCLSHFWSVHRIRQFELQPRLSLWLKNSWAWGNTVFFNFQVRKDRDWSSRGAADLQRSCFMCLENGRASYVFKGSYFLWNSPTRILLEQLEVNSFGDHSHRHYKIIRGTFNCFQILLKEVKKKWLLPVWGWEIQM